MYNALACSILLYGSEIWTPRQRIKTIGFSRNEIFQKNCWVHTFGNKSNGEIIEELTVESVDEKLRGYKSLATTCNRNEQQQDTKNMVNYRPNGQKATWKTYEETIR